MQLCVSCYYAISILTSFSDKSLLKNKNRVFNCIQHYIYVDNWNKMSYRHKRTPDTFWSENILRCFFQLSYNKWFVGQRTNWTAGYVGRPCRWSGLVRRTKSTVFISFHCFIVTFHAWLTLTGGIQEGARRTFHCRKKSVYQ